MARQRGTIACEFCWQYAVPEAVHDLGVAVGALRVSLAEAFRPMAEAMARAVERVNAIFGGAP